MKVVIQGKKDGLPVYHLWVQRSEVGGDNISSAALDGRLFEIDTSSLDSGEKFREFPEDVADDFYWINFGVTPEDRQQQSLSYGRAPAEIIADRMTSAGPIPVLARNNRTVGYVHIHIAKGSSLEGA